jgi:NAD(P)-dependent dehydrogenase (short-subunit alcohol dehydrogenase family)
MTMELPLTPSFGLKGKRALVTGASRGIGLACASALAAAGAEVLLWARNQDDLVAATNAISEAGGKAQAFLVDVCDIESVRNTIAMGGVIDILVNNAGTNRPKHFTEVSEEDYDAVLALNLRAAFFVSQAVAQHMIRTKCQGSIIHIGSQMGHVGGAHRTLYCASKWALEGLNKAMALDLACFGIRSNIIAPTFIETPMTLPFFQDESFLSSVLSKIKLGRLGKIEDIMGAVVFLASSASLMMTGSSMLIDGGWTAD